MDFVIRNARLSAEPEAPPIDIDIAAGTIVALEPGLPSDLPSYDAAAHLTCGGLIETHIHLDKTRIIDRCEPETGRNPAAVPRVAAVKHTFTEQVALRRLGNVEDCAKVVEFLTTDLSDYVSGQCIAIDGGMVRSA